MNEKMKNDFITAKNRIEEIIEELNKITDEEYDGVAVGNEITQICETLKEINAAEYKEGKETSFEPFWGRGMFNSFQLTYAINEINVIVYTIEDFGSFERKRVIEFLEYAMEFLVDVKVQ